MQTTAFLKGQLYYWSEWELETEGILICCLCRNRRGIACCAMIFAEPRATYIDSVLTIGQLCTEQCNEAASIGGIFLCPSAVSVQMMTYII